MAIAPLSCTSDISGPTKDQEAFFSDTSNLISHESKNRFYLYKQKGDCYGPQVLETMLSSVDKVPEFVDEQFQPQIKSGKWSPDQNKLFTTTITTVSWKYKKGTKLNVY